MYTLWLYHFQCDYDYVFANSQNLQLMSRRLYCLPFKNLIYWPSGPYFWLCPCPWICSSSTNLYKYELIEYLNRIIYMPQNREENK